MRDFDLVVGWNLQHLLALLADNPDAQIVAGATDLIPFVQAGKWRPRLVVDITGVRELGGYHSSDGWVEIGPLVTHGELANSTLLRKEAAALAEAAASVGDPMIRNRATIGGNICTASPAADTVPALLILGTELTLLSQTGSRCLPLSEFLIGPGKSALRPGEVLAAIRFPIPAARTGTAFLKLGKRQAMAISVANAAALVERDGARITSCRLALGALAPTAVRCPAVEASLKNKPWDSAGLAEAAALASEAISPIDDVRASASYRRLVAPELARRVLVQAGETSGRPL
jgi:CO/xanthine dehydrogenase FAD-binding subunit